MKKLIISLLFICIFVKLFSQNTANSFGRILYTVSSQKIHRSVEMWFTSANYLYTITNSSNLQNSETLKNRKFNSIEDSLNEVQKLMKQMHVLKIFQSNIGMENPETRLLHFRILITMKTTKHIVLPIL
jgi:general stress protein CsbA